MVIKLGNYLASSTPVIFVPTVEDSKVEQHVVDSLINIGFTDRDLAIWKVTSGMITYKAGTWVKERVKPADRPVMEFISAINKVAQTPNTVGIFYHVRRLINEPGVIQTVIDAAYLAKVNFSAIIFVGSYLDLPPELYNIVTYCDFPLPSKPELESLFDERLTTWEKINDITLPKNKKKRGELISKAAESALGLDEFSAENALALAVSISGGPDFKIIQAQKEQHIKKSDVLEYIDTTINLDDVGGFGCLKQWLARRKEAFSDKAIEYGLKYPKGILLAGLSGGGKSYVAKAVASYLELPLLRLDFGKVFKSLVGSSEETISRALKIIEAVAPVVVLADEAEKLMSGLESSGKTDSGVTARVLATFLTWRQETTKPVFMIYTANDPDMIPPMVYRKGRVDEIWAVELPIEKEREEIFRIHLRLRNRLPENFDTATLAAKSDNFTGAEIEATIEEAMFNSFYDGVEVNTGHILNAISNTMPQSNIESEDMKRLAVWVKNRARSVSEVEEEKPSNVKKIAKLTSVKRSVVEDEG